MPKLLYVLWATYLKLKHDNVDDLNRVLFWIYAKVILLQSTVLMKREISLSRDGDILERVRSVF